MLDVYIGDAIGTGLAKTLRKKGIEHPIIFLTSSIEHAPQSFKTGTLRYLLKPLDFQKLHEALDAAGIYSSTLKYSKKRTYCIWGIWVAMQTFPPMKPATA